MEGKEVQYTDQEGESFLDGRLPDLTEIDPSEFDALKGMMITAIRKEIERREQEGREALTKSEIMGNLQYAPRAIEKTGGAPLVLDSSKVLQEGGFSSELFERIEQLVYSVFPNLKEEIANFLDTHGYEMKEIMDNKGNFIFLCTHPSWYGLLTPALIMGKLDKSVLKESLITLITAIGPLMVEKELLGMKVNPQDLLVSLGINVLKTVPHNGKNEKHKDVLKFGNILRHKFGREFVIERGNMKRKGGRSLILAPEGTTTPVGVDGVYEIAPIDPPTAGLLEDCVNIKNNYFVILGLSEENKNRRNDLEPTRVEIKAKIISPDELQQRMVVGNFSEGLRSDMAELVDGRVQESLYSPQHSESISE